MYLHRRILLPRELCDVSKLRINSHSSIGLPNVRLARNYYADVTHPISKLASKHCGLVFNITNLGLETIPTHSLILLQSRQPVLQLNNKISIRISRHNELPMPLYRMQESGQLAHPTHLHISHFTTRQWRHKMMSTSSLNAPGSDWYQGQNLTYTNVINSIKTKNITKESSISSEMAMAIGLQRNLNKTNIAAKTLADRLSKYLTGNNLINISERHRTLREPAQSSLNKSNADITINYRMEGEKSYGEHNIAGGLASLNKYISSNKLTDHPKLSYSNSLVQQKQNNGAAFVSNLGYPFNIFQVNDALPLSMIEINQTGNEPKTKLTALNKLLNLNRRLQKSWSNTSLKTSEQLITKLTVKQDAEIIQSDTVPLLSTSLIKKAETNSSIYYSKAVKSPANLTLKQRSQSDVSDVKNEILKVERQVRKEVINEIKQDLQHQQQVADVTLKQLFSPRHFQQLSHAVLNDLQKKLAVERYRKGYA